MTVALHFEDGMIRAVAARRSGGRWVPVRHATVQVAAGGLSAAVEEALVTLGSGVGKRGPEVVAVLPRSVGVERLLDVPALRGQALNGLITHELEAQLPWPVDTVLAGYTVISRRAGRLCLLAAAVRKQDAESALDAIRQAGGTPVGLTLSDLAFLALGAPAEPGGMLLCAPPVDGTSAAADIICLSDGRFRFSRRVSDIGGEGRGEGCGEVERSLQFAKETLGLDVRVLAIAAGAPSGDSGLTTEPGLKGLSVIPWRPAPVGTLPREFWAAYGAIIGLCGVGGFQWRSALTPNLLARRPDRPGWVSPMVAALVLSLALSGGLNLHSGLVRREVADLRREVDTVKGPREEAARLAGEIAGLEAELAGWRPEKGLLSERLTLLEELAGLTPSDAEWTGLTLSGDRLVDLSGRAPSAIAVVEALQKGRGLAGIGFTGPVRRGAEGERREEFHIGGGLRR